MSPRDFEDCSSCWIGLCAEHDTAAPVSSSFEILPGGDVREVGVRPRYVRVVKQERRCAGCGEPFVAHQGRKLYCTSGCRDRAARAE